MANTTPAFTFKVKAVTKKLLSAIPERSRIIISKRFGIDKDKDTEKMTLEAIGEMYDITRERVRQIEANSLAAIRKSNAYKEESKVFIELANNSLDYMKNSHITDSRNLLCLLSLNENER